MKRNLLISFLVSVSIALSAQECDINKAIMIFGKAQEQDDATAAVLYEEAAYGFKCCQQPDNYLIAAYQSGSAYLNIDSTLRAKSILEEAITDTYSLTDTATEVNMLIFHTLGEIYYSLGNSRMSIFYFDKAAAILGTDDSEILAICLYNKANACELEMLPDKAVECHRQSIAMKERLGIADSSDYYQAYSALADIFQATGNPDSAAFYFGEAGRYIDKKDSESVAYIKFKNAQKLYVDNQTDKAEELFDEAKKLCEVAGIRNDVYTGSCLYLGIISEQNGKYQKASNLLQNALNAQIENNGNYYNILLASGRVEGKIGNTTNALAKLEEVRSNSDSRDLTSRAAIEIAEIYKSQNQIEIAEKIYTELISTTDSTKYPIIRAQAICGLGNLASVRALHGKAIANYKRALGQLGNADRSFEAVIYEMIGNEYFATDSMEQALCSYTSAYEILKSIYGSNSHKVLDAQLNIANVRMAEGQFAEAEKLYAASLSAKLLTIDELDIQLLDLYSNMGNAEYNLANYNTAEKLFDKAFRIVEVNNVTPDKLDVLYNNYGLLCKAVGNYKEALRYVTMSLDIKQAAYGVESARCAGTINNLGTIYDRLGNFDKAVEYFETAEQLYVNADRSSAKEMIDIYINKGNLYNKLGQNDFALDYYNRALNICANQNADTKWLVIIYNNIGAVYQNTEDNRQAQFYFNKSLDIIRQQYGDNTQEAAESYNNIGTVLLKTGNNSEAIVNFQKANNIYSHLPAVNPILTGNISNNIATAYFRSQKADSALYYYNRAVEIYKSVYGDKHPNMALIYNSLGDVELSLGRIDKAIIDYSTALEANHEDFVAAGNNLPDESGFFDQNIFVNSLLSRAAAFSQCYLDSRLQTDLDIALQHYRMCDRLIVNMRHSAVTKTDKLEVGKIASKCYEGALEVCAELINIEPDDKNRDLFREQAFMYMEKGKSNALLESIVGQDAMQLADIPQEVRKEESQLSADVLYFEKMLAEHKNNSAQVRDSLLEANNRHNAYIKKIETEYPEYHQLKYADRTISLRNLQAQLPAQTQMRMYMLGKNTVYIVGISQNSINILINNSIPNLSDSIRTYRNSMMQLQQKAMTDFNRLSYKLYQVLFPDTIPADVTNLIIVPDGALCQIPFESLLCSDTLGFYYPKMDFLIRRYSVSYAYSASLYSRSLTRKTEVAESGWIGIAPVFTQSKYRGVILDSKRKKKELPINGINVVYNNDIEPLASSETEVRGIFTTFVKAAQPAKAYLWGCAAKTCFNNDSLSGFRFVHLATHGFVNSDAPELSGIQFCPIVGDSQGGMFFASDVYNLKLNCDLLVLSACETGLGKIVKGEGIVGLTRAFLFAGAANLLVSLWQVSDISTSLMMQKFYSLMLKPENSGLSYAELLRQSKMELISGQYYSKPYFWAPFIIIGN